MPDAGTRRAASVSALLGIALCSATAGAELQPLPATNLTPFTAVLGQPSLRSAAMPPAGSRQWHADVALASHSGVDLRGSNFVYLDGETLRLEMEFRHQLSGGWQLAIALPWVSHRGGFLDSVIDSWHSATGLANGQRDLQGRDRVRFEVSTPRTAYRLRRSTSGPGDLRLQSIHRLPTWRGRNMAVRATIEAPTGDAGRLTGNGAVDVAVDWLVGNETAWRDRRIAWHAQVGLLLPGRGDLLPSLRRRAVPFAGIAAGWAWQPRASVFAQLALTNDPWLTPVKELGSAVAELTLGLRIGAWHLGFSEDLRVDRSPDFVARLGWNAQLPSR